jgi:hypothetical protein
MRIDPVECRRKARCYFELRDQPFVSARVIDGLADVIFQAVRETAEECARVAAVSAEYVTEKKIRTAYGIPRPEKPYQHSVPGSGRGGR